MKPEFEITDAAIEAMRNAFHKTYVGGAAEPYRAALAAALPFCKPPLADARLKLFDGRFTLPLVVKSYPGVSFIHPANAESAPLAVITCDDHPTVAAGLVDAVAAASEEAKEARRKAWREQVDAFNAKAAAAFRANNAEAMQTIRDACGSSLDTSWAEKARELFGDQKRSTLLVIGAALAKIAAALPGRVHIEVGYPDDAEPETKPDAWMRAEDSRLLAKGHAVIIYPHRGAFTEFLPVYLSSPPVPAESKVPAAETRAAILRDESGLIDRIYLNLRKVAGVSCYEITDGWQQPAPELVEARLVEYLGPKIEGNWSKGTRDVVGHKVASVAQRSGSSKASRKHGDLSSYVPDTDEARTAFEAFAEAWREQKKAEAKTKAARAAIPRVTLEMVADLIRIYESEKDKPRAD